MDRNDKTKMDTAMRQLFAASKQIEPNMQMLIQSMQNMEQGLMEIGRDQQILATSLDACRLTQHMMFRMLTEKGIMTQEEVEERYKAEVVAPMQKMQEEIIMKIKAAQEAASNLIEPSSPVEELVPEVKEEEVVSDVVLPSERNNVIVFPGK